MAYATRQDIEAIYGVNHLQTLVAHDVDFDMAVNRALAAAEARIDPYLRKRYTLPLPLVPDILQQIAIDIACWILAPSADRVSEQIEKRAKLQLEFLKDVAAGKADIAELTPYLIGGDQPGTIGTDAAGGAAFSADARRWPSGGGIL